MSEWILPFQGRNTSYAMNQNFLWKSENIYIMDNHRAAYWCWLQHQDTSTMHSIMHIDAHYDTADAGSRTMDAITADISTISFEEYLAISYPDENVPIFRWDNYLSIYSNNHSDHIAACLFATHGQGSEPSFKYKEIKQAALVSTLESLDPEIPHIINFDLDYFRSPEEDRVLEANRLKILSQIKSSYDSDICSVLTICLSPECCGGWSRAEELCAEVCDVFNLSFTLSA